jgi:hypothetical protein
MIVSNRFCTKKYEETVMYFEDISEYVTTKLFHYQQAAISAAYRHETICSSLVHLVTSLNSYNFCIRK